MKAKQKLFSGIISIVLLGTIGCERDFVPSSNPKEAILGKWVMIANEYTSLTSHEWIEYLPDSVMRLYDLNTKELKVLPTKYVIGDSLLQISEGSPSGYTRVISYTYKFQGDKLFVTDMTDIYFMIRSFTYQRIK